MKLKFGLINTYKQVDNIELLSDAICFHGDNLDDRGDLSLETLNQKAIKLLNIKYDEDDFRVKIKDMDSLSYEEYLLFFKSLSYENIIIESTTLGFVEILYLLKGIKLNSNIKNIQIIYFEPQEYKFKNNSITTYNDFQLSDRFKTFPPIPGFSIIADIYDDEEGKDEEDEEHPKIDLIAFLGFEKNRLGQIFSSDDGATYKKFIPIIPLPGFNPGWENITINNHLKFFKSKYNFQSLEFTSANDPYNAYKQLEKISKTSSNFRVAPIGTKPNSIGCAIFMINSEDIPDINYGILYDFPVKSKFRSKGIGKVHIYNIIKE